MKNLLNILALIVRVVASTGRCLPLVVYISLALLAACGGGGGDGGGGGSIKKTYSVGGTVSGLTGSGLVLQNNGGDDLAVSASGPFTFATALANSAAYSVTVLSQPSSPGQICTVTAGSGNITGNNVTGVTVSCVDGANGGGDQFGSGPDPIPDRSGNPTSADLIASALAAGTITKEQAIVYEMYADFNDARLPQQYRGDDVGVIEGHAYDHAADYIAAVGETNVSPATIDALRPFITPPYYESSWWHQKDAGQITTFAAQADPARRPKVLEPRISALATPTKIGWTAVPGTNVVVWYQSAYAATDAAKAATLVAEYDNTIWPKLTTLMGRPPKSDLGTGGLLGVGLVWTEDDGRLDVFLDDLPGTKEGRTSPMTWSTKDTPVRIYLKRTLPMNGLISQAAHEFMHAIQFSYAVTASSVNDYRTTKEATATWASHFVYPANHWETKYARHYLLQAHDKVPYDDPTAPDDFAYGAYVFPLFLETQFTSSIIRGIWDSTLKFNTELAAIEGAIVGAGSTFAEAWRDFIVASWNQEMLKTYHPFGVTDVTTVERTDSISMTNGFGAIKHDVTLPHASMAYYRVVLSSSDRSLTFVNGLSFHHRSADVGAGTMLLFGGLDSSDRHGASMQVYLKVNGAWLIGATDLTHVPWFSVCRDDPAGRIEEAIFIYGNGEITPGATNYANLSAKGPQSPGIVATDIGCRDWTGTMHLSRAFKVDSGSVTLDLNNVVLKNIMATAAPPPTNPKDPPIPYPLAPAQEVPAGLGFAYQVTSGSAKWNYDRRTPGPIVCTTQGKGDFQYGSAIPGITLSNWAPPGTAARGLVLAGLWKASVLLGGLPNFDVVKTCGSDPPVTENIGSELVDIGVTYRDQAVRIAAGGLSVTGDGAQAEKTDPQATGTWSLTGSTN